MKTVWTFVIITFVISMFMHVTGIGDNQAITFFNNLLTGSLDITHTDAATLWVALYAVIAIMIGISAVNTFTGGNASVGITAGFSALAAWCLIIIADLINIIKDVGSSCAVDLTGLCNVGYYIIWFYMGIIVVGFMFALVDLVGGND